MKLRTLTSGELSGETGVWSLSLNRQGLGMQYKLKCMFLSIFIVRHCYNRESIEALGAQLGTPPPLNLSQQRFNTES